MSPQLVIIAIGVSFIFEISYFFFIQYLFKAKNKKSARIADTFIYELTPKFSEKTSFINYVLLFGVIVVVFPYIYYGIYKYINTYSVTLTILNLLLILDLCIIPFFGLDKLKEHLFADVIALVLFIAVTGIESYYCFYLYRLYDSGYQLAGMIAGLVLFVFSLAMIINPKLFDLKNDMDEEGAPHRKKAIYLALSEWLMYPLLTLSLIPILLISM